MLVRICIYKDDIFILKEDGNNYVYNVIDKGDLCRIIVSWILNFFGNWVFFKICERNKIISIILDKVRLWYFDFKWKKSYYFSDMNENNFLG